MSIFKNLFGKKDKKQEEQTSILTPVSAVEENGKTVKKQFIKRHNFSEDNKNFRVSYFQETESEIIEDLQFNPRNSGFIFKSAFDAISDAVVCDYPKEEIMKYTQIATELGINAFRNTMATADQPLTMTIQGDDFEVTAKPDNAYSNPAYWQDYFYCAQITGNRKFIDELIAVPEEVFRASEIVYDEVDFANVRFLKGLYQDVELAPLLMEALKKTAHELNDEERLNYLDYIKVPELELYIRIFGKEQEKFNIALVEALESHKKYWKKDPNDPEGWISFPIICACIIAYHSYGFKIDVESDYLPMWLVK